MKTHVQAYSIIALVGLLVCVAGQPALASDTVYGQLFEAANLTTNQTGVDVVNRESTLLYYPDEAGLIAITTAGGAGGEAEWWTSDELGVTWTRSSANPLEEYDCTQAGRHSPQLFNSDMYFSAACTKGASIFKLTGTDTVELVHTLGAVDVEGGQPAGYPTATVLDNNLYMFFNGGFTRFDGTTGTDVTTATGQGNGVPLDVSQEQDGSVYIASTSGLVQEFDGTSYTTIGSGYLEEVTDAEALQGGQNLPAIEALPRLDGSTRIFVGNQDEDNGASLFMYDTADSAPQWDEVYQLPKEDGIINKMAIDTIGGQDYLVFYTGNDDLGTTIYGVNADDEVVQLVDSGLGGTTPENNTEVVSVMERSVTDRDTKRNLMVFGTQNDTDQTKIYTLLLGVNLALDSTKVGVRNRLVKRSKAADTVQFPKGKALAYAVPADDIKVGDTVSLWVNGKIKKEVEVTDVDDVTLRFKKTKSFSQGKTFELEIGVQRSYGSGDDQLQASNTILGDPIDVKVVKRHSDSTNVE